MQKLYDIRYVVARVNVTSLHTAIIYVAYYI